MALRDAFQFPRLNLRDRFLREYARLSDPPIRWLTRPGGGIEPGGGGDPDATAPTGVPGGDVSIAGRGDLAEALSNPVSPVSLFFDVIGLLAGPLGVLAGPLGKAAVQADNAGKLAAAIAGVGKGEAMLGQRGRTISGLPPGLADPDAEDEGAIAGMDIGDLSAIAAEEAGPDASTSGPPGPGDNPDAFRRGGPVRDRMTRPGGEEVIRAHEGEFVVRKGPAKKYRRLLAALNAGQPPDRLAALVREVG